MSDYAPKSSKPRPEHIDAQSNETNKKSRLYGVLYVNNAYAESSFIIMPERIAQLAKPSTKTIKEIAKSQLTTRGSVFIPADTAALSDESQFSTKSQKVYAPPAHTLKRIFSFLYSKKTFSDVFEPGIEDMRLEYYETLQAGALWHARWIHFRGVISLIKTAAFRPAVSVIGLLTKVGRLSG